jgi:gamma-glutamyltranspeptidase
LSAAAAAIAAPHRAALEAAREAARAGGNTVDMALAAAVTLTVVYPHQCALGGDLVALVRAPDGTVVAHLSAGRAPAAIPAAELRARGERLTGAHAVTVPGVLAGWEALATAHGTIPLRDHLLRAADLAAGGVEVVPGLAAAIQERRDAITADPGLKALLMPRGTPLGVGDTMVQPRLAATLRTIAADGIGAFYGGSVGEALVAGLRRLGGAHTADDLAAHRAEQAAPLATDALGATWHVAPPPTQGVTLLALLRSLEAGGGPLTLEAVRAATAARDALLGDPALGPIDLEGLMTPEACPPPLPAQRASGDTVAVAAASGDGTAVSLIQSVFMSFGAGILEPETGIVCHNRGSAFSLVDGHPGAVAPRARPPHTLCPLVVTAPGDLVVAAGCQGGRAQPQILAQLAPDLADPSAELAAALARPRWVVGVRDIGFKQETVLAEPGADAPTGSAEAGGVAVARSDRPSDLAGHAQVVRAGPDGVEAASDPRADGDALFV